MSTGRGSRSQMVDQMTNDGFAQTASLMPGIDCDVDNLKCQSAIADDAAHANHLTACTNNDSKERVWQADGGAFSTLRAQARNYTEEAIFIRGRSFEEEIILFV